jgi:hypothetical protein
MEVNLVVEVVEVGNHWSEAEAAELQTVQDLDWQVQLPRH